MGCSYTFSGLASECKDNAGGIKAVYIGQNGSLIVTPGVDGTATVALATEATKLKRYNTRKFVSSMTSTATIDEAAGTVFYTTDLALQFNKMTATKWVEMEGLVKGDMQAIVQDNNGIYYVLGSDFPVTCSAATGVTGVAMGEMNGYTVTLQDLGKNMPYTVADVSEVIEEVA